MLQGRVLDANDAAQGIETPLAGVTVCHLESGKSTRTDINGNFVLTELPATESHIEYIGRTAIPLNSYASYRAKVVLTANNATTIERPIYLMKIDSNGQKQIDPTKTTTLTNENLGMELTIPPRTVKDDRGNNFAGEMSISEVPAGFTPGSLPIRWSQVL
jgi:hypothetical protein